jgi:hypothetical protein
VPPGNGVIDPFLFTVHDAAVIWTWVKVKNAVVRNDFEKQAIFILESTSTVV